MITYYERHPLSAAFPVMGEEEFAGLLADIDTNGQKEPIWIYEDKVLDGWHRHECCRKLGREPLVLPFEGDDPVGFVLSHNLHRRHLTPSQRAMAVVECSDWAPRGRPKTGNVAGFSKNAELTKTAQVAERTIRDAKVAKTAGLSDAVKEGAISVSEAAKIARGIPEKPKAAKPAAAPAPAPAPEPEAPAVTPAPNSKAAREEEFKQAAQEANGDFDALAELEQVQKQVQRLEKEIEALTAEDTKAQLHKALRGKEQAQMSASEAMDNAKRSQDREKWVMRQLMRCGKAVGEDDPTKIAAKVEAMAREAQQEAA